MQGKGEQRGVLPAWWVLRKMRTRENEDKKGKPGPSQRVQTFGRLQIKTFFAGDTAYWHSACQASASLCLSSDTTKPIQALLFAMSEGTDPCSQAGSVMDTLEMSLG